MSDKNILTLESDSEDEDVGKHNENFKDDEDDQDNDLPSSKISRTKNSQKQKDEIDKNVKVESEKIESEKIKHENLEDNKETAVQNENDDSVKSKIKNKLDLLPKRTIKLTKLKERFRNKQKQSKPDSEKLKKEEKHENNEDEEKESENVFSIKIHKLEVEEESAFHPSVKVHIIDLNTRMYLTKSNPRKQMTSHHENELINYILPVMSKPSFLKNENGYFLWEDSIVFNEEFEFFIKPEIILFFEILDFQNANIRSEHLSTETLSQGIFWSFLRPISLRKDVQHVNHEVRLQLYLPTFKNSNQIKETFTNEVVKWLNQKNKKSAEGSLNVTIGCLSRKEYDNQLNASRSKFLFQETTKAYKSLEVKDANLNAEEKLNKPKNNILIWNRIQGQHCRLPKTRWHSLVAAGRGCFCSKFSNDGLLMACGCPVSSTKNYSIFIYEVPSFELIFRMGKHNGIVYEIDWSFDNNYLLSVSNDCTAQIWQINSKSNNNPKNIALLPHPCYLYNGKFHPTNLNEVITGGFDGIVRIWLFDLKQKEEPQLIQEFNSHKGSVLCFCWENKVNEIELFSSGNDGVINIYKMHKSNWKINSQIVLKDLKNVPINSLSIHPNGNKIVAFCRDGIHRLIDYKSEIIIQQYKGSLNFSYFTRGCISPCGQMVFTSSEDGSLLVWKANSGEKIYSFYGLNFVGGATCIEYHPFDHILSVCGLGSIGVIIYHYKIENSKALLDPIEYFNEKDKTKRKLHDAINMLDSLKDN